MGRHVIAVALLLLQAAPVWAEDSAANGGSAGYGERFFLELGFGFGKNDDADKYHERLAAFDFKRTGVDETRITVALGYRIHPNIAFGINYLDLDGADWKRHVDRITQRFAWDSLGFGAFAQGDLGLGPKRVVNVFVRAGLGLALASSTFDAVNIEAANADSDSSLVDQPVRTHAVSDSATSYFLAFGAGITISPIENFGVQIEARQSYAPVLENELGDKHDVGGLAVLLELHLRSWE